MTAPPNRLREAREYLGITKLQAALFVKVTEPTLELLEANGMEPQDWLLARFSRLYQRPIGWLRGDPEEDHPPPQALLDFARGQAKLSDRDAQELARFALFLRHRGLD